MNKDFSCRYTGNRVTQHGLTNKNYSSPIFMVYWKPPVILIVETLTVCCVLCAVCPPTTWPSSNDTFLRKKSISFLLEKILPIFSFEEWESSDSHFSIECSPLFISNHSRWVYYAWIRTMWKPGAMRARKKYLKSSLLSKRNLVYSKSNNCPCFNWTWKRIGWILLLCLFMKCQ